MNKHRLLILADALETRIPQERFDLANWRYDLDFVRDESDSDYESRASDVSDDGLLHGCGTTGCAVGWACALPEFKAEGLSWNGTPALAIDGVIRQTSWVAVEMFFDLTYDQAHKLFDSAWYGSAQRRDPRAVSNRIREMVAEPSDE